MTVPVHGLPPLLREGMEVAMVPPPLKESRWHVVRSVGSSTHGQLARFSNVDDIGAAEALVGMTLLADVTQLPDDYLVHDVDALIGREVVDEVYGPLGDIIEVMSGIAQDVWVVEGTYGEALIPVVEEFVLDVPEDGPISVRVPEGTIAAEEG